MNERADEADASASRVLLAPVMGTNLRHTEINYEVLR